MVPQKSSSSHHTASLAAPRHRATTEEPLIIAPPRRSPSLRGARGALHRAGLDDLFIVLHCSSCSSLSCHTGGALHCAAWLFEPFHCTAPEEPFHRAALEEVFIAACRSSCSPSSSCCTGGAHHCRAMPEELFTVPPSSSWSPFNAPCWRSPSSSLPQRSPSLRSAGGALYHAALEELFIVPRCSCSPSLRRPRGAHHHSAWLL